MDNLSLGILIAGVCLISVLGIISVYQNFKLNSLKKNSSVQAKSKKKKR